MGMRTPLSSAGAQGRARPQPSRDEALRFPEYMRTQTFGSLRAKQSGDERGRCPLIAALRP